jgi:hypothetical protein
MEESTDSRLTSSNRGEQGGDRSGRERLLCTLVVFDKAVYAFPFVLIDELVDHSSSSGRIDANYARRARYGRIDWREKNLEADWIINAQYARPFHEHASTTDVDGVAADGSWIATGEQECRSGGANALVCPLLTGLQETDLAHRQHLGGSGVDLGEAPREAKASTALTPLQNHLVEFVLVQLGEWQNRHEYQMVVATLTHPGRNGLSSPRNECHASTQLG